MDKELAIRLLGKMMLVRKFEENVQYYFSLGMIHGTTHLGIGEEATDAGTCLALTAADDMFATHRGHGAAICKGIDIRRMMAEIFGKSTGVCKGRGGSMHIADKDAGVLGANGIVGPSMALACGAAFAHKRRGEEAVAAAFFGDGATNEGIFHESMNLASVWGLPVLFVCINNLYGMSTHISRVMKDTNLADRAIPYAMKAWTVDGNDAEAVCDTVTKARAYALSRKEPVLIVENTYRISGHSKSDGNLYRTKEEINYWKQLDPIRLHEKKMLERGLATQKEIEELERQAAGLVEDAVNFAIESPYPKVEDLYEDVYAE
ncbi:MAG: thiamine pyrophosphate-dependent dehydrogenase E1 component subunit alpha [Clostridiales bacterium]|jgi:pyruvate dehydrogenase E1 component alpha subunit|uniref:thiamine pyrophosphate-dependent dehydrogenase E1 component subunit alpha n=1 Tax=Chordicoccus furentiruminis TaxID=2709410 RepID=UPI0023A812AB|nr:thiamine pyrophosphate-dependent dehydrogenase E1 component subunit alpha [Chordicoccus furentiruminis]MCI6173247.1 thiamine pyrophosphate-dependent dehydrogenase E1 component subunit alpha [Clostridiales bacterium]